MEENTFESAGVIRGLRIRELSGLRTTYDKFSYSLSDIIALVVKDEETRNDILQKTFIRAWHEAESYEPGQTSVFIWLLRISLKVAAEHMEVPLLEMQKKAYHAYRELKANEQKEI